MNEWREDGDLRHVFLETCSDRNRCHLCLKERRHIDHVPYSIAEEFQMELPKLIEARISE